MRVLKFGGSSVAKPETIANVISIVKKCYSENPKIVLVVSAQGGVTDLLVKLCSHITNDHSTCKKIISAIEERHIDSVQKLFDKEHQHSVIEEIRKMIHELSGIVQETAATGGVTPQVQDLIVSFGERLSATIISQSLRAENIAADYADARKFIRTDETFGYAKVDFPTTHQLIKRYFGENTSLQVVTGFIASSPNGHTTTLGRSGSDYTAAIVGAALDASVIEIWTDVDGVMTADPRLVKEAQTIQHLSYIEAMELSHFGAKVIFPLTMQPAMEKQIPILVKNTFNPSHPGSLIGNQSGSSTEYIKGISSLKNVSLVNIEGSGMMGGVTGVSARIFSALETHQIHVVLISQASSEHSLCLGIMQPDADRACKVLKNTFSQELQSKLISSIYAENNVAIVAVVGENMRNTPGISSRVFKPLGSNGINVKAISQGSSELNISIVVEEADLKKTLQVLHQSLFKTELVQLHLYIAGTGSIGSKLLSMIEAQQPYLAHQKIALIVCGICNTRNMQIGEEGISLDQWHNQSGEVFEKANLSKFIDAMFRHNKENSVFIDVTASDEVVTYYTTVLHNNVAIVTANKRANTQSMKQYNLLHHAAQVRNTPFHYETNVGAGLPVINVLQSLRAGSDEVLKIEAVLSGTLNYLLSEYDGTNSFSDLVKYAKENNYSEPDPRDDLSGMDVARKCLILARECGWELELEDIKVESLMPDAAAKAKDMPSFFHELKDYNTVFHKRFEEARKKNMKIRYVATIENGKAQVNVQEVEAAHAFYSLIGTENCICLTSKYYNQYPMVVKGPGAGVNVTSAGVLADIVRIAEGIKR